MGKTIFKCASRSSSVRLAKGGMRRKAAAANLGNRCPVCLLHRANQDLVVRRNVRDRACEIPQNQESHSNSSAAAKASALAMEVLVFVGGVLWKLPELRQSQRQFDRCVPIVYHGQRLGLAKSLGNHFHQFFLLRSMPLRSARPRAANSCRSSSGQQDPVKGNPGETCQRHDEGHRHVEQSPTRPMPRHHRPARNAHHDEGRGHLGLQTQTRRCPGQKSWGT